MTCPVVIQTCDKYERFWDGLFRFMDRHWDRSIESQIYFCNEESNPDLPHGFRHIKTGKGTFVQNLRTILGKVGEENVFYMLEDFWPISPMGRSMFDVMHKLFSEQGLDALQISSYLPYYSLDATEVPNLFRFRRDSPWIFNFQARFWKSTSLLSFLCEPEISESEVNSAITVEMASDQKARNGGGLSAMLLHYAWYPISGVSYRGEFTELGGELQNLVDIDRFVEGMFSKPTSWKGTPP